MNASNLFPQPTAPLSELLTPDEAANYLGVSARTLATWRSTGRHALPFIKVGSRCRYRRQDLEAWLNSRMHEHTGHLA
ncbi:MAG: hypothetical protein XD36_2435 [Halomonas sp. 54_146]|nr:MULTISPECIES: helix-turn-helix domain-containing protein [unclassified Halomonas]KUJ87151.1 MAG: hypothetical protein XD36_2435 [Halomonas sp. 54_146]HAA44152.1 DNA-binding protein [Halomonas sp.]